jgi:predicted transcriptional regulator
MPEKIKLAKKLYADTSTSVAEICKMLGISRHTLQWYVKGTESSRGNKLKSRISGEGVL